MVIPLFMNGTLRKLLVHVCCKFGEPDKRLHMVWSFWLTLAARLLWPMPWAIAVVVLLGLAKECWDARFGSGFCWYDLVSNLAGICVALLITVLLPDGLYEQ